MIAMRTYDCDGCGEDVLSTADPRDVVLVLCAGCNRGQQIPSLDPEGEYTAWLEQAAALA